MKQILTLFAILLFSTLLHAQVGINNTDPKASLDISATNQANPSNTDGLLIPRIDDFPATNPTAAQQGMMVYLTTASGGNPSGFYSWDNNAGPAAWLSVVGTKNTLDQAYDEGGAGNGKNIMVDNGELSFSGNSNILKLFSSNITDDNSSTLNIRSNINSSSDGLFIYLDGTNPTTAPNRGESNAIYNHIIHSASNSLITGLKNQFVLGVNNGGFGSGYKGVANIFYSNSNLNGDNIGIENRFDTYSARQIGVENHFRNNSLNTYGIWNHTYGNTINSEIKGIFNDFDNNSNTGKETFGIYTDISGSSSGNKYGSYININQGANGTHFGVYSAVPKSGSYAGFFLGRVSFGATGSGDSYLFPLTRGTNGQIMQTDGSGNINWVDTSTIDTDDQTIDQFALSGTTLGISLEDDGAAPYTVDLSSLQDGTGTDDQTVDQFGLSGTTLGISLEDDGASPYTVNLSSLQDGTGTDDQNIFGSGLSGTDLTIGIENGSNQIIDLSSLQDGTGTDNQDITSATLSGTSLAIAIENGASATVDLSPLQDADWYETGGTPPNSISDDIYTNGNVGIGVNLPTYKLDVRETAASDYVAQIFNLSTNTTADALRIKINAAIPNTANNFIGFFNGSDVIRGKITGTALGVNYATTSDRRLKTKIINIDNALSLIENIQPRKYEYKANLGTPEYGFIAQELQLIYPQAVIGSPDSNVKTDPMMVDYSRLTPILTAGIKELNDKVTLLETENKNLKKKLSKYEQLEARLSALENKSNLSATDLVVIEE